MRLRLYPFFILFFLFSCNSDDNNLTCNGSSELSTLNIYFYDRNSTDFTALSLDSVWVTVNNDLDTLINATSVDNISLRLSPIEDSTSFSILLDSSDAIAASLVVKYDQSTEFVSQDCGYSNRFSIQTTYIDSND